MKERLKKIPFLVWIVRNLFRKPQRSYKKYKKKIQHQVKERAVTLASKKVRAKILVETGTFRGTMVSAVKNKFSIIHSIELDVNLFEEAQEKFKIFEHIKIHQGDSAAVLPEILKNIKEPVVFWLDAHYSGGITARGSSSTPIEEELLTILSRPYKDAVIIDDARDFNGTNDYPTIPYIEKLVKQFKGKTYTTKVSKDIIHIIPNE